MYKLLIADLKMMTRNRQALFWAFMFPIMFTFIFGLFFGKTSSAGNVLVVDKSKSELSTTMVKSFEDANIFKVTKQDSDNDIKTQIDRGKISAALVIPEKFGTNAPDASTEVKVISDQGNAQVSTILANFVDKFLTQVNYRIINIKPIYSVTTEKTSNRELTYFDFVLAGILGLALMNSSVIGIAVSMAKYREDKILKRIVTTPVKSWQFIGAEVISRLVLNIFQISAIVLIGKYVFNAHFYGNYFILFSIALLGALLFQLIGFVIASFSKTTDGAQGMTTAITIPMMFLAGVFFPIDSLPRWLYSIVQYLPLAPLLRMIRGISTEGLSPFNDPKNIIILGSWIVFAFTLAIYKFKLSEE